MTALVYGLAVAGESTVRALLRHGVVVKVADDTITDARCALASELGVELVDAAQTSAEQLLVGCTLLCPAPGVPEHHPIIVAAQHLGLDIVSEIELAYRWEQERPGGPRPMLAVTGTDGKTSTTKLTVAMLEAAGVRSVDAGNTATPLVDAIDERSDDGTEMYDAFVVECSSFRLAFTPTFRANAAVWLNVQPDHLNWHTSMASYEAAKAQVFANQQPDDVVIGLATDAAVVGRLATAPGRTLSFGLTVGEYRSEGGLLIGPLGTIAPIASLRRKLPHDITNALAASALVLETGLADPDAIERALGTFVGPPHRLERLWSYNDADWFNDSKATTPHAASAAIRSFENIVLIAGGADKGVDLSSMADEAWRCTGVLAIGATASTIADVFASVGRVESVDTLERAVERAAAWARPGDTVLLSPGCASLDQFTNFEVRGEAFRTLFTRLAEQQLQGVSA